MQEGLPVVSAVFSYFNPARSPYYSVIGFGTLALILSSRGFSSQASWFTIAISIYAVLIVLWALSFKSLPVFKRGEHEEQLRFARSSSIASALLTLVLTAKNVEGNALAFSTNFGACILQILTFILYAYVGIAREEPKGSLNFVQLTLITTTLLVGASYALGQYVPQVAGLSYYTQLLEHDQDAIKDANATGDVKKIADAEEKSRGDSQKAQVYRYEIDRFLAIALGLYALWLSSVGFWLMHLSRLFVLIRSKDDASVHPT